MPPRCCAAAPKRGWASRVACACPSNPACLCLDPSFMVRAKFAFFVGHITRMDALFEASFSPLASSGAPPHEPCWPDLQDTRQQQRQGASSTAAAAEAAAAGASSTNGEPRPAQPPPGKPLSKCGKCRRYMKYISARPQRLYCPTCEEVLPLPQVRATHLCAVHGVSLLCV